MGNYYLCKINDKICSSPLLMYLLVGKQLTVLKYYFKVLSEVRFVLSAFKDVTFHPLLTSLNPLVTNLDI
jgi:hypothetical protein